MMLALKVRDFPDAFTRSVPLTMYIARAAETANMMFGRAIEPASFVLSFVITMAFSVIVAAAMRPKLTRVDMVESLKSIE